MIFIVGVGVVVVGLGVVVVVVEVVVVVIVEDDIVVVVEFFVVLFGIDDGVVFMLIDDVVIEFFVVLLVIVDGVVFMIDIVVGVLDVEGFGMVDVIGIEEFGFWVVIVLFIVDIILEMFDVIVLEVEILIELFCNIVEIGREFEAGDGIIFEFFIERFVIVVVII